MKPSSLRVKFLDHETLNNVVFYNISITDVNAQKSTWFIKARYSQMRGLHLEIEKSFQGALPDFPPKKFFGNLEPTFISQRKKHLENYFNTLLRTVTLEKVVVLRDFLMRGKEVKEIDKKAAGEGEKQARKPSVKKEENKEEGKEVSMNSMLKATGGNIEKIVDFFTNKMLEINMHTTFPEEEEVLKRKVLYQKLALGKVKTGGVLDNYRLPKGCEGNLVHLKKESKITENTSFFKELDAVVSDIIVRSQKLEEFVKSPPLVHQIE